jgi:hypothetical protein
MLQISSNSCCSFQRLSARYCCFSLFFIFLCSYYVVAKFHRHCFSLSLSVRCLSDTQLMLQRSSACCIKFEQSISSTSTGGNFLPGGEIRTSEGGKGKGAGRTDGRTSDSEGLRCCATKAAATSETDADVEGRLTAQAAAWDGETKDKLTTAEDNCDRAGEGICTNIWMGHCD